MGSELAIRDALGNYPLPLHERDRLAVEAFESHPYVDGPLQILGDIGTVVTTTGAIALTEGLAAGVVGGYGYTSAIDQLQAGYRTIVNFEHTRNARAEALDFVTGSTTASDRIVAFGDLAFDAKQGLNVLRADSFTTGTSVHRLSTRAQTFWGDELGAVGKPQDIQNFRNLNPNETVTVFRVQGGNTLTGQQGSRHLVHIDDAGNVTIQQGNLNVSIGNSSHAQYFQSRRPGSNVTSFDIPKWMDNFIQSEAIPQRGYRTNPLNQGGLAPKIVDPTTPGQSYELPGVWAEWLQENAVQGSGKVQ